MDLDSKDGCESKWILYYYLSLLYLNITIETAGKISNGNRAQPLNYTKLCGQH